MVRLERDRDNGGIGESALDLQVSTVQELPVIGSLVECKKVGAGSIAQVIQTGAFYTLDENGTWYDENGEAAS